MSVASTSITGRRRLLSRCSDKRFRQFTLVLLLAVSTFIMFA
jgi:hypothetical protein